MLLGIDLHDTSNLIRLLLGAALGGGCGTQLPRLVRALIEYKCKKRGRDVPENILTDRKTVLLLLVSDALLSALAVLLMPPVSAAAGLCIIQVALLCVCVDYYMRIIANETVLLLLALGVVFRVSADGFGALLGSLEALGLVTALFGGLAAVMMLLKGSPEVGAGDIKFAMAAAVAVGWPNVLTFLFCFAGAVLVYIFIGIRSAMLNRKSYFPMCLHLSVGLMGGMFLPLLGLV